MRLPLTDLVSPKLKSRNIRYAIAAVFIVAITIVLWRTQPPTEFYITAGWLVTIAALVWWGNRFLTRSLDKLLPWNRWGNLRFFTHLIAGLLYILLLMNATYFTLKIALTEDPPVTEQWIVMNVYGAVIFIPAFSIYFSLHFLKHWRKSELEVEKFQKENIRSQLESLKNHLDPHFLFNNLNILSALVEKDPRRSRLFIEKFAEVYRTLLKTKADDLISLGQELEFIEAYMYLIRTRFEDHILFTTNIKPEAQQRVLPPATLQMLFENAIKHNIVTPEQPLTIQLLQLDDDYLIVSNSLKAKAIAGESEGTGLENIRNRYAHFTDKPVKVVRTNTHFEVHIPLLAVEHL